MPFDIPKHGGKDPDGMNDQRVTWGGEMIATIQEHTGTDLQDALADGLADLMHWSHANGYDFEAELRRACFHFEAETGEG